MNRYTYVWNPKRTLADYFDTVIKYPDDTHIYNCGPEWFFGRINHNNDVKWMNDPEFAVTLKNITEFIEHRPDVKSRMIFLTGEHSSTRYLLKHQPLFNLFGQTIRVWDYFWWHCLRDFQTNSDRMGYGYDQPPHKLFICLQHRPHPHKVSVAEALCDTGLVDSGTCTWCGTPQSQHQFHRDYHGLPVYQKLCENSHLFKNSECDTENFPDWHGKNLTAPVMDYQEFLFDVVSESSVATTYFSEKTFKPIFFGKPFVILGSTNQNSILKSLGYETFPEYFDFTQSICSTIDDMRYNPDLTQHYKKILKPLTDLSEADISYVYDQTRPKVKHNHSVMVRQFFDHDLPDIMLDPKLNDMSTYKINVNPLTISQTQSWFKNHDYFSQFVPQ